MKKLFCFIISSFSVVIFVACPSYAFVSAITDAIKAAEERAHRYFVEAKWVENIRIITQNYEQSKSYYEYMKAISSHEGGVGGYIRDRIQGDVDRSSDQLYWEMENHLFNSDPEDTAYVKKWVTDTDKRITVRLDYSKQIHDIGMNRDAEVKELAAQGSNPNPSAQEVNRYNRTCSLLTIDLLNELNKNIAQILKNQAEAEAREWEQLRSRMIADGKSNVYFGQILQGMRDSNRNKKDPYSVLRELPK